VLTKFGNSQQIYIKITNFKLHRNVSGRNVADMCRWMEIMKPKGTFVTMPMHLKENEARIVWSVN